MAQIHRRLHSYVRQTLGQTLSQSNKRPCDVMFCEVENDRRQKLWSCPMPHEEEERGACSPVGEAWRRGKVSCQANGHTTVNIMELSRLAGSGPSCPIRYCLISSAKQPLLLQPCCHLLPPTRWLLPSTSHTSLLPASARPRPKARTWLLTVGGSLFSFFPYYFWRRAQASFFCCPSDGTRTSHWLGLAAVWWSGRLHAQWQPPSGMELHLLALLFIFPFSPIRGIVLCPPTHTHTHSCEVEGRQRGV